MRGFGFALFLSVAVGLLLPASATPIEVVPARNQTFRSGLTYLVGGPVRLEGTVRFEAGCVIKFLPCQ